MALFKLFSNKELDEFAKGLAQDIAKRYPPALDQESEKKISQKRLTTILEDAYGKAIEYKKNHKLGVYKKARLGNAFRWELVEMGYSKAFVFQVTAESCDGACPLMIAKVGERTIIEKEVRRFRDFIERWGRGGRNPKELLSVRRTRNLGK